MLYFATFDVAGAQEALGTITFGTSGKPDAVVDIAGLSSATADATGTTTLYQQSIYPLGLTLGHDRNATTHLASTHPGEAFFSAVVTELQAQATAQGWTTPSGLSVSVDPDTGFYTIAYSVQAFSMTFSNVKTRELFGYAGNKSGSSSYTSDNTPDYIVNPTSQDVSDFGGLAAIDYEPEAPASTGVTDGGAVFGIARTVEMFYRDWYQQYETRAKARREFAEESHPFTFQELFETCRARPFLVSDGFGGTVEVFQLRTEGSAWKPERATAGNDNQFHIPFLTVSIGSATTPS